MSDITHLKIKDIYTNRVVPAKTPEELGEWVRDNTVTKGEALDKTIAGLVDSLNSGTEVKWHGAANGLEIVAKTTKRRRK